MVLKSDVYPTGYKHQAYASQQAGYVPSNGGYQSYGSGMTDPGGYSTYPAPGPQSGYASGPSGTHTHGHGHGYGHGHSHGHGHGYGHGPTPHGYAPNCGPGPAYGQQYPGAGYHSVKDVDDDE